MELAPVVSAELAAQSIVRVLPRLTRHLVAEMHGLPEATGLSWPQFRVLGYLSERDYRASELADVMEIGRSTLTTLGDGLARRGLIERIRDLPGDRRGVLMRLTEDGHALHTVLKAHAAASVTRLLADADPADLVGITNGLGIIEQGLCALCAMGPTPESENA